MPIVTFEPSQKRVQVEPGTRLLSAARRAGVPLASPCGGEGACGECAVRVASGDVQADSPSGLPADAVAEGHALACSTRVKQSPVVVQILSEKAEGDGGQFAEQLASDALVPSSFWPAPDDLEPMCIRLLLQVAAPEEQTGLSDADRLTAAIVAHFGPGEFEVEYSIEAMRLLAGALRAHSGKVAVTLRRRAERLHVIQIEAFGGQDAKAGEAAAQPERPEPQPEGAGRRRDSAELEHYGIAVDVGTTTIAVQLLSLPGGRVISRLSDYNDQMACGSDVIGRINYARKPQQLEELRERVLGSINRVVGRAADQQGIASEQICEAYLSGNTTMMHLLLGLPPEHIRIDPYTPTVHEVGELSAAAVGIRIHPPAPVLISPAVGSYVGGDITAGLLCTHMAHDREEIGLFMDIGTNGELVVGNRDFLTACACSAGPAFEGGGMACGMRAAYGALERVEVDPQTGMAQFTTVRGGAARGLCGSGIISLLASLFLTGWMDPAGKLNRNRSSAAIQVQGRRATYTIVPESQSATGRPIAITEAEIESVIRAKAAVYSACALMLAQIGIGFQDLATVYVAGGFGSFLDLEAAIAIGLIPDLPRERFHYLGNASLAGTTMALISRRRRELQRVTARRITYLELNTDPEYMDQYTAALFLPHTDLGRFPSQGRPGNG